MSRSVWVAIFGLFCSAGLAIHPAASAQGVDPDVQPDNVSFKASDAVPLDSWVYPAFYRLTALGFVPSAMQGMRPWTRLQCARLLEEAHETLDDSAHGSWDPDVAKIVARLDTEFFIETGLLSGFANRSAGVTDAYVRATEIAGPCLRDSYHFGQTIYNDFGRPYGQGFNAISGVQVHAQYGPVAVALRGEYQDARAMFAYADSAIAAINSMDGLPAQQLQDTSKSRMRPVEATVALKLLGWQATFGEQSQWWGQGRSGSLILSNNAEAPVVLLVQRDKPVQFPWVFAYLGKINNTFFIGELRGHHYVRGPSPAFPLYGTEDKTLNPQPMMWGDQIDLKISPNFEVGFEIACMWAGYGRPATLGTWLHTFNFHGNNQPVDPGKRFGGFHFSYRLPNLRNVTLYADSLSNDEPTPVGYPTQSAMNPGIYLARLPRLPHMDARVEGVYTDIPNYADGVGAVYFNLHYADGYRNAGQLMGSWIGRAGIGVDAKTTYWFSGVNKVDFGFRHQSNDVHMIGGGSLSDYSSHLTRQVGRDWQVEAGIQAEKWEFPVLRSSTAHNVATTFKLVYAPAVKGAH